MFSVFERYPQQHFKLSRLVADKTLRSSSTGALLRLISCSRRFGFSIRTITKWHPEGGNPRVKVVFRHLRLAGSGDLTPQRLKLSLPDSKTLHYPLRRHFFRETLRRYVFKNSNRTTALSTVCTSLSRGHWPWSLQSGTPLG